MCDERFAVEGLVSGQNQYADHVPHGCMAVLAIWVLSTSGRLSCFPVNYSAVFLGMMPAYLLSYDHASGLDGVQLCPAAEQGTSGGRKISRGSALRGGRLWRSDGIFVTAIRLCAPENRSRTMPIAPVPAGGRCAAAILLINGIMPAAAATVLAQKRRGCSTC